MSRRPGSERHGVVFQGSDRLAAIGLWPLCSRGLRGAGREIRGVRHRQVSQRENERHHG